MDNKILSRKYIYDHIFDFSDDNKKEIFQGIVLDAKDKFRMEQIEERVKIQQQNHHHQMMKVRTKILMNNLESEDWGGSRKDPFTKDEPREDNGKVQKRHRSFGKREFKGKSPLATNKASTLVAHEGMLDQLKKKFGRKTTNLLSEDNILEE